MAHEEQDGAGRRDRYADADQKVHRDGYPPEDETKVHPGWAHQPQTSYDAAHSGGWGGPGQAETGPLQLTGAAEQAESYADEGQGYAREAGSPYVEPESAMYAQQESAMYAQQESATYAADDRAYVPGATADYRQEDAYVVPDATTRLDQVPSFGTGGTAYPDPGATSPVDPEAGSYLDQDTVRFVDHDTVPYVDADTTDPAPPSYPAAEASIYRSGPASAVEPTSPEVSPGVGDGRDWELGAGTVAAEVGGAPALEEPVDDDGEAYIVEPPSYGPQSSQHAAGSPGAPRGADAAPPPADTPQGQGQGWFAYAPPSGPQQQPSAPPAYGQEPAGQQPRPATTPGAGAQDPSATEQPGRRASTERPASGGPRRGQRGRGAPAKSGLAAVLDFSFAARATRLLARPLFWLVVAYGVIEVLAVLVTLLSSPALGYSGGAVFFAFLQALLDAAVKIALARLFLELCVNVSDLAERHAGRTGRTDRPDPSEER